MLTQFCTFAETSAAGWIPAQVSLPHSPVANAHVSVFRFVGITVNNGCRVPVTAELITLVFQFMLIVTSLYGPNTNGPGGGVVVPPPPPVPPPPVPVPPPPPVPVPPPEQLPDAVHGCPLPEGPLLV